VSRAPGPKADSYTPLRTLRILAHRGELPEALSRPGWLDINPAEEVCAGEFRSGPLRRGWADAPRSRARPPAPHGAPAARWPGHLGSLLVDSARLPAWRPRIQRAARSNSPSRIWERRDVATSGVAASTCGARRRRSSRVPFRRGAGKDWLIVGLAGGLGGMAVA
jgi:hypothetical protein